MATEEYANTATTTVSSGGTDAPSGGTSESWTVASSTPFPAASTGSVQFHVADPAQPSEIILVTNISGTTWTVTRGAESTTPVAHLGGFTIWQVVTAGDLTALMVAGNPRKVTLTDAATVAVNASLGSLFSVTLGGNRTLGNPSSPSDGQRIIFEIIQDGTGSRTLAYGSAYAFPASIPSPTLSSAAGDRDFLTFIYDAGTSLWYCTGWVPDQNAGVVAVAQGGTGQSTQQAALNALAGAQTSGYYLRGTGSNVAMAAIQAADLPAATTSAQGAVELDGTGTDITALGVQAAGSTGKAADAGHVHPASAGFGLFGDGSDGACTLDGTNAYSFMTKSSSVYTLNRNAYLTSLTVNNGVTLVMGGNGASTGGFQIYCQGTVTNNGTTSCNGNSGAASGTAGAVTGSGANAGGRPGGAGGTTTGTAAATFGGWASSSSAAGTSTGSAGGTGTSGNTGGAGGVATASQISLWYKNPFYPLTGGYQASSSQTLVCGGQGGGGGGGDGTHSGGGGGSGGGLIVIFAYSVVNNGTMSATGGTGGTPTTGNCGGGGGGGGGAIITYTLSAWTAGTTAVTGGTQGSGFGSGSAGTAGANGSVFNVVL